jgi:hypothetical protein
VAREEATLDELVGVVPHDFPVLAGAGLSLVRVDDKVVGTAVGRFRHKGPLETGGEPGNGKRKGNDDD